MLKPTELKIGKFINLDKMPYEILEYSHSKLGRGGAIIKTKLKNLKTGAIIDKTFKGQEKIAEAALSVKPSQFLYKTNEAFYFMDSSNFSQFSLTRDKIGLSERFLKEGLNLEVLFSDKEPISIKLPIKADFRVKDTEPGVKGDTASAATKEAAIETGFKLQAPLFIKAGDIIRIDTRDGSYIERVK